MLYIVNLFLLTPGGKEKIKIDNPKKPHLARNGYK
jgi:hypothetical protein